MTLIIRYTLATLIVASLASTTWAAAFFSDSFESGDMTHTENGAHWFSGNMDVDAVPSTTVARTGNYSARFRFGPGTSAEERFDLGSQKQEVWIRFYVYFPANYTHKTTLPYNDKLIRLWNDNDLYTNNPLKQGASLVYDSSSKAKVYLESMETGSNVLDCGGTLETFYTWGDWKLTAADLERWIEFKFHFKLDNGTGNGAMEFYVDGELQMGRTNQSWVGAPCGAEGHRYFLTGYLFGSAYTANILTENMDIYVDDVVMSDTDPGSGDTPATPSPGLTGVTTSGITIR